MSFVTDKLSGNVAVAGNIAPVGNTYSIGSSGNSWQSIYAGNLQISNNHIISTAVSGDIVIQPPTGSNLAIQGNVMPYNNHFTLGSLDNPWDNAYFGSHSITILPDSGNTNIVLENLGGVGTLVSGGFAVDDLTATYNLFKVDTANGFTTVRSKGGNSTTSVLNISNNPSQTIVPPGGSTSALLHLTGPSSGATSFDMDCFDPSVANNASRDRKSTRLNSSHVKRSRMPSSA